MPAAHPVRVSRLSTPPAPTVLAYRLSSVRAVFDVFLRERGDPFSIKIATVDGRNFASKIENDIFFFHPFCAWVCPVRPPTRTVLLTVRASRSHDLAPVDVCGRLLSDHLASDGFLFCCFPQIRYFFSSFFFFSLPFGND